MAVAAVHGSFVKFVARPYLGWVASHLVVAHNASIERVAALEAQGDNITLAVVVRALGAGIHVGASQGDGR